VTHIELVYSQIIQMKLWIHWYWNLLRAKKLSWVAHKCPCHWTRLRYCSNLYHDLCQYQNCRLYYFRNRHYHYHCNSFEYCLIYHLD